MSPRAVVPVDPPQPTLRRVVRVHPPIGLSTLFRPLGKCGDRPKLHVRYAPAGGTTLVFSAREALGVPEQSLLLVLLEVAGEQFGRRPQEVVMDADERSLEGRKLLATMSPHLQAGGKPDGASLHLTFTWRELNARLGSGNGGSLIHARRELLKRLCEVAVWEESAGGRTRQSFLAVWLLGDDQRIHVALNYRLASALLGGQYAQVSLAERFALRSDTAMAVHAFFSTCIRHGHSLSIGPAKLASRLWPDGDEAVPEGTRRRRLTDVRRALSAIDALPSWSVVWEGDVAVVRRLQVNARDMTHEGTGQGVAAQGLAVEPVRDMTLQRHDLDEWASFCERSAVKNINQNKPLSRYDVPGLFITTE